MQGYTEDWTESPWADQTPWTQNRAGTSPRRRTQSPRKRKGKGRSQSRKGVREETNPDQHMGKGAEKGKTQDKGGAAAFGHLPPSTQWLSPPPPPFQSENTQSSAPSGATTSTAMQPFGKSKMETTKEETELAALRNLHAQLREQPGEQTEEVKKALAVIEAATRKEDAKSYRHQVSLLDKARKKLSDIEEQWEAFRTQWTSYLDNATKMWTAHIESYEEGEHKFSQKRKEAAVHLQQVRTQLHEIHMRTMAAEGAVPQGELQEGQTALDATMSIAEMDDVADQPQFSQLKSDLRGVVQRVKDTIEEKMTKRSVATRMAEGDEIEIVEPADKKQRDSN